jgi:triosephosphate isomerase
MARKPIIAGNWKMHMTVPEAAELIHGIIPSCKDNTDVEVVVAPPFTAILAVAVMLKETGIKVAAQNMHHEPKGAFTGEVSAGMLVDAGCEYVIIGHSERRQYFHETDESVNMKLAAALDAGLTPIVCVGETLAEREGGKAFEVIERQLVGGLRDIGPKQMEKTVLAYEPVWAIGTGKTATPAEAQEVHAFIRAWLVKTHGEGVASAVRIQYGGSVKPDNVKELMAKEDIDGALVGGASLKADSFAALVNYK